MKTIECSECNIIFKCSGGVCNGYSLNRNLCFCLSCNLKRLITTYKNNEQLLKILIKWYLEQCKYDNMSDEEINKILVSILL